MHKTKQSKLKIESVLRRFHHKPLDLCAYSDGHMDLLRRSKVLRTSALISSFALVLLITAIIVPLYNKLDITEATTGTAKESSLSFNLTNSTATVDLSVNKANGVFNSSTTPASFNISTTNYTGYTLSIKGSNSARQLVNSTNSSYTLSSISSTTNSNDFSEDSTSAGDNYNGKWGYLPSKINSSTNANYLPAPTTTASTLDKTSSANSTANTYTIGIGARASYTTPAGEYTGTYILTAIGNTIAYYISFSDNSDDSTVAYIPGSLYGSVSTTSVTLPSTIPTRTGYTFRAWCLGTVGNSGTTCSGTEYGANSSFGLDQTSFNGNNGSPMVLYATWTINTYPCYLYYRLQNADSSYPNDYTYGGVINSAAPYSSTCSHTTGLDSTQYVNQTGSEVVYGITNVYISVPRATYPCYLQYRLQNANGTYPDYAYGGVIAYALLYGSTCTFTSSFDSTQYVNQTGSETVYGNTNVYLSIPRTSYYLTVSHNTSYIGSSTGSGWYLWGATASISATASANNKFTSWSQTAGTASSFGNTAAASTTFVMPASNATVYANGEVDAPGQCTNVTTCMQTYTLSMCQSGASSSNVTLTDARDGKTYTVRYINGQCWMTQNLRFTEAGINSATTNIDADKTLNYSDFSATSNSSSNGPCYSAGNGGGSYDNLCIKDSGDISYGVYYSYSAATAGTITGSSNSTVATYDICPKNWHLPTGPNTTSGTDFYTLVGNIINGWQTRDSLTVFNGVAAGYYLNNSLNDANKYGYWWSATDVNSRSGGRHRHTIRYDRSSGQFNAAGETLRSYGVSVRCIRTS